MADFDSSLPIRTQQPGDVAVKLVDSTNTAQGLAINVDGSINATVSATNLDIRDLSHAQDSIKIGDGTDFLAVNADGSLNATVSATNLDIRDLAFATDKVDVSGSSVTVSATNLDIRDLAFATDKVDVSGSSVTVSATALDIRALSPATDAVKISDGTDNLAINADGSLNVVVTSSVAGSPIADYKDDAATAAGASANHDYTVTAGKQLKLIGILASASGKCRVEVQIESAAGSGIFNTKFVGFNSTANPNIQLYPAADIMVPAGAKVRVIKTNKDNQAQDLYSTIEGSEI